MEHCRESTNSLISQAVKKYGKENFSFQIVEETSDLNQLNNLETKYIKEYNSLIPYGYNIVLIDDKEHHQFNKYDIEVFSNLINDIKNSTLSFKEIAEKYNLDLSMIYYINRGSYHSLPNEVYPLRTVKNLNKQYHYCLDCGIELKTNSLRCIKCSQIYQRKKQRPNRNELKKLIRNTSFVELGKQYNVSDNAIRKWCKYENLPFKKSEIKKYSDQDWEKI